MSTVCANCHLSPIRPGFQYCGKRCGSLATTQDKAQTTALSNDLCEVCHQNPKYSDPATGKAYSFCGKACATQAQTGSTAPVSAPRPIALGTCQISGCNKPAFSNTSFCGIRHRDLGKTVCLWCQQKPQYTNSAFCGKGCMNAAESLGPILLSIPKGHDTFKSVEEQFKESWRHGSRTPSIRHVYKIILSPTSRGTYEAYRASVASKRGLSMGNQCRRWHGSRRVCHVGDKGATELCNSSKCGICGIIQTSYKVSKAQRNISFGRFGAGIYTSSTSSKADSYATNSDTSRATKAMFLNYVVVGRGSKLMMDNVTLTGPPAGYDSVLGEAGFILNHDECIVYRDDAIRPAYLVIYDA